MDPECMVKVRGSESFATLSSGRVSGLRLSIANDADSKASSPGIRMPAVT